jgi:hypothetical protein
MTEETGVLTETKNIGDNTKDHHHLRLIPLPKVLACLAVRNLTNQENGMLRDNNFKMDSKIGNLFKSQMFQIKTTLQKSLLTNGKQKKISFTLSKLFSGQR